MPRPLARNRSCVATSRTWLMLPGADGKRRGVDGLDGVDHERRGLDGLDLLEDALQRGLGRQEEPAARDAQPLAAQLDLALGLLARDVEHGAVRPAQQVRDLQQQRALADAGLAADQHHRAGHDAAAQDAVELADARRGCARPPPRRRPSYSRGWLASRARPCRRPLRRRRGAAWRSSTKLFHSPQSGQRAEPLRALEPARLAREDRPRLAHRFPGGGYGNHKDTKSTKNSQLCVLCVFVVSVVLNRVWTFTILPAST